MLIFVFLRDENGKETTLLQHYQRRQLAPRPRILTGLMELISTSCDCPAWTLRLLQAIGRHHRETTDDKGFYISLFIFITFCESLDANIGFVLSCSACDDQVNYSDKSKCHGMAAPSTVCIHLFLVSIVNLSLCLGQPAELLCLKHCI